MTPNSQPKPVALLNIVGLVVAAPGIMIQYLSGVDHDRNAYRGRNVVERA